MLATVLASEGASPLAMILVGIGCIAFGIFAFVRWNNRELWSDITYAPRREMLFIAIALFGVASVVGGFIKA